MSTVRERSLYQLPESTVQDLETLREMAEQFKAGEITALQFRAFRVPAFGCYEQREAGTYMLRVRLPAGVLLPQQMRALARVSKTYGNGILHLTTRQDIQVHEVPLDAIHPALVSLYEAGLSTKGGGGNTVRNITACYDAGVCHDEVFDVTPYALTLSERLLSDPLSYQLPRKYKIAFAGCSRDCPGATVNDLGFIARRRGDALGFAVYAGGGMGTQSRVADLLEEFVPASEVYLVAEAVKRVFDQHGNRKNRRKARLRFLIDQIGFEAFRDLYRRELAKLQKASLPHLVIRPLPEPELSLAGQEASSSIASPERFEEWQEKNVLPQKQEGYYMVQLPFVLGDVEADMMQTLADVVEAHGEGMLRAEQHQNVFLRWIPESQLVEMYAKLSQIGLTASQPPILRDMVSCAGASTCQLGICLSRGLAKAIARKLPQSDLDLHGLGELAIHISGCPNSCGRHPIAPIGFFGAARRVGGRLAPHYVVVLGGRVEEGRTRLAERRGTIPARNVPTFLGDYLAAFSGSVQYPDFDAFLEADGKEIASALVSKHKDIPDFEEDKNPYFDWGAERVFSLAGRGPGECGAGVFDLIEVDLASAGDALDKHRYFEAASLAARALLVTRGEQANDDAEAFALFNRFFVEEGLVDPEQGRLISAGLQAASTPHPDRAFDRDPDDVAALVAAVKELYDNMDSSLRFPTKAAREEPAPASAEIKADSSYDFQGVVCPLNYVKTKLALEQMEGGQVLEVLLDDEGAKNVPESAARDGHKVLSTMRKGDHWQVIIRKKAE
jgi:sulfite reductase (ferredoxin)